MAKAIYTTDNTNSFTDLDLTILQYFTLSIRRYPDMMVHRLLDRYRRWP